MQWPDKLLVAANSGAMLSSHKNSVKLRAVLTMTEQIAEHLYLNNIQANAILHVVNPKKIYLLGEQLYKIVRSKNFALNNLSRKFTETIIIANLVIPENFVVAHLL